HVTGVQTCALPISRLLASRASTASPASRLLQKSIKANACFALLDHPTSDPRAATAKWLGMVGMVVAPLMHHQCQPLDIAQALQAWRQDRLAGLALGVNHQGRKVAQVAVAPRFAVLATVLRVPVTACGSRRSGLAVDVGRLATALCVQVETVGSSLQASQYGLVFHPELSGFDADVAQGFANALSCHGMDR